MRNFILVFGLLLALPNSASARVVFEDMLGRWCQVTPSRATYVFSRKQLAVTLPDGSSRVLEIEETSVRNGRIRIQWKPYKIDNSTEFEFDADKHFLYQVANTTGDMGPRRKFRRC